MVKAFLGFLLGLLASVSVLRGQAIQAPININASDRLYPNEVRITWQHPDRNARFMVYRNHVKSTKGLEAVTEKWISSNSCSDRGGNVGFPKSVYYYYVVAERNTKKSALSEPDQGSPMIFAAGHEGGTEGTPVVDSVLYDLSIMSVVASSDTYAAAFAVQNKSDDALKNIVVQFKLSEDAILSDDDQTVQAESLNSIPPKSTYRKALVFKRTANTEGRYLILHVEGNKTKYITYKMSK